MLYNLIMIAIVIVSVSVATNLGKGGPKWKAPVIAVVIFIVALLILEFIGIKEAVGA